ncbi:Nudix family hydrolase [Candidatus Nitrosacidococcus sp. I8]|uniref:Nudix family hydrolase n=1 Tax=Candidatus Nitrosacidococcus sp. I8 TaxID=2942908 RepID=UPI0022268D87|nr:Nudix family hydrolase [Candidatus Nitrosacidococcus sp. I8]CAH9014668.1 Thiamine-phosphate synthase [Candidatus Nitrosacidococcus sp. I8]
MLHQVAIGVIINQQGQVLLAKRALHVHQGNLWEFPGGKLELRENTYEALIRELKEELDITILSARPLLQTYYHYPDRLIQLNVYKINRFSGVPRGKEGQPIVWVFPQDLKNYAFPPASQHIIKAILLPSIYLITSDFAGNQQEFLANLKVSLDSGIRLIQLRVKNISQADYIYLAEKAKNLCANYQAALLVNSHFEWINTVNVDGIHLTSNQLMNLSNRPLDSDQWVVASCHNKEELAHAARIGVDFAVLGPVFKTQSHPNTSSMGWQQFQEFIKEVPFPVYGLGGLTLDHIQESWNYGAQGIAAIGVLWGKSLKLPSFN